MAESAKRLVFDILNKGWTSQCIWLAQNTIIQLGESIVFDVPMHAFLTEVYIKIYYKNLCNYSTATSVCAQYIELHCLVYTFRIPL